MMDENREISTRENNSTRDRFVASTGDELGEHIARVLQLKAEQLHFTPALYESVMQRLPTHKGTSKSRRRYLALSLATAALLVLTLGSLLLYAMLNIQSNVHPQPTALSFVFDKTFNTPSELANGGQLLSFDPTGQHLLYTPAGQPGVMYTTDLDNAITANLLAMRDARDISWSPDGANLVTTIHLTDTLEPLLALVPVGKYMRLLGHEAVASAWSSVAPQSITFVTQSPGRAKLWETNTSGSYTKLLATMQLLPAIQRLDWSPDGQRIALVVTNSSASPVSLQQPAQAIYVMDTHTKSLHQFVAPGKFTIGKVTWSPNGKNIAFEQVDTTTGQVSIHGVEVTNERTLFSLELHEQIMGWSWSPNSMALVYSDEGTLHAYTLQGPTFAFPATKALQAYPCWLSNGRIVFLQISGYTGQLTSLVQSTKR